MHDKDLLKAKSNIIKQENELANQNKDQLRLISDLPALVICHNTKKRIF